MISIILPTYNSIRFLEERVVSILNQTFVDWECLVIDGMSEDGSWEYLERISKQDKRFKLFQYPPKGVYDAWNKGLQLASGTFIYFATSDDTMAINCLKQLYEALRKYTDCSIAHCCLSIINETGASSEVLNWDHFPAQQFYAEKNKTYHVRKAPEDGILYCTHGTTYHSFTQLLIKKEVFDRYGLFLTNCGSIADFDWAMRVALVVDTVHVPEYLATWRFYDGQSTNLEYFNSWQHKRDVIDLIKRALLTSKKAFKSKEPLLLYQLWMVKEMLKLKAESKTSFDLKDYYLKFVLWLYAKPLKSRLKYHKFLMP